ncbi:acyl carrier protein [Streptomyces acidiscabies]|uniref:acyl carrier protein n=1 Tax=Streptomyces acidiscabies TaxID=42234 RepID=UPI00067AF2F4|nr:acyl carrier protein [Streptomyces acidiscabies]
MPGTTGQRTESRQAALQDWLTTEIAQLLGTAPEDIDRLAAFGEYGLESISGLTLAAAIEDHLGIEVDPTVVWDHPSIDALATHLIEAQAATS